MKKIIIIFLLSFTILTSQTLTGTVSHVSDGDTIHIVANNKKYKIRFYGIDTPEKTQEYGLEAKEFVYKRIANKIVKVRVMDTDSYGRKVGKIYYNGKYLNKEIVKNGYAWWYKYYAENDKGLERAEKYAKTNELGLWKSSNPIAPWSYRRMTKKEKNNYKGDQRMKIKSLHHVCIQTENYRESKMFYTEILGFKIIKETPNFHGREYNTWLKLGEIMIELQTAKVSTNLNKWSSLNEGPVHISFLVENVQNAYKEIKSKGYNDFKIKNKEEIYKVEDGYLFKVKAPEGTEIEVRDNQEI